MPWSARSLLAAEADPAADARRAGACDRAAAPAADDRGRDRRGPAHAALDRLGDPETDRTRKRSRLEPLEPPERYECARPGELLHIDVKKLARFHRSGHRLLGRGPGRFETAAGYEYLHVCVDDHSRLAYVELLPDERGESAVAFLRRALAFFAARGVIAERVLTDKGSAFVARCYAEALRTARAPPYPDAPTPPADKRKARALHPDPAQRVGPRTSLR